MLDQLVQQQVQQRPSSCPLDAEVVGFDSSGNPTLDEEEVIKIELVPRFASVEYDDGSLVSVESISLGQLRGWWDDEKEAWIWQ